MRTLLAAFIIIYVWAGALWGGDVTELYPNRGKTADLGAEIAMKVMKSDLLVVLLVSEKADWKRAKTAVSEVLSELREGLKPREAARLKWAVVSYGTNPTLRLQPTDNVHEILAAIAQPPSDSSAAGDLDKALLFSLKVFAPLGKPVYVILAHGAAARPPKLCTDTSAALDAANGRLYALIPDPGAPFVFFPYYEKPTPHPPHSLPLPPL
ncbi:MAG: hypothetical protein NTV79_01855 [Candidatus Aureabacteria bacterium]|nr:hypothetical protein [Candidatus Auribacterota bacterium]